MHPLSHIAANHVRNILDRSMKRSSSERVLVVYDRQSGLAAVMADAYQIAIPDGIFLDFDAVGEARVRTAIDEMNAGDVVALVQSTNFRLNEFRVRIELFNRKLKVIEHVHLNRMPEEQWATWVDTLSFDPGVDGVLGRSLKTIFDPAETVVVECGEERLVWTGGMEPAKLNIGDYTAMQNVGGTFPIGEMFNEAKVLENTQGSFKIYAFADENFLMKFYTPFIVLVEGGLVVPGPDAPPEFVATIEKIRSEERPIIREFGLGLNRAITREKILADITAFERILGLHFSLGEKHSVYKKPGIPTKSRYHVDVFPAVDRILVDGTVVFERDAFLIP